MLAIHWSGKVANLAVYSDTLFHGCQCGELQQDVTDFLLSHLGFSILKGLLLLLWTVWPCVALSCPLSMPVVLACLFIAKPRLRISCNFVLHFHSEVSLPFFPHCEFSGKILCNRSFMAFRVNFPLHSFHSAYLSAVMINFVQLEESNAINCSAETLFLFSELLKCPFESTFDSVDLKWPCCLTDSLCNGCCHFHCVHKVANEPLGFSRYKKWDRKFQVSKPW